MSVPRRAQDIIPKMQIGFNRFDDRCQVCFLRDGPVVDIRAPLNGIGYRVCGSETCSATLSRHLECCLARLPVIRDAFPDLRALHPIYGPCTLAELDAFPQLDRPNVPRVLICPDDVSHEATMVKLWELLQPMKGQEMFGVRPKVHPTKDPSSCDFCHTSEGELHRVGFDASTTTWFCVDCCSECVKAGYVNVCGILHVLVMPELRGIFIEGGEWQVRKGELAMRMRGDEFVTKAFYGERECSVTVRRGEDQSSIEWVSPARRKRRLEYATAESQDQSLATGPLLSP